MKLWGKKPGQISADSGNSPQCKWAGELFPAHRRTRCTRSSGHSQMVYLHRAEGASSPARAPQAQERSPFLAGSSSCSTPGVESLNDQPLIPPANQNPGNSRLNSTHPAPDPTKLFCKNKHASCMGKGRLGEQIITIATTFHYPLKCTDCVFRSGLDSPLLKVTIDLPV